MQNKTHLRFLLALGNKKVIVTQDQQQWRAYSNGRPRDRRVSAERVYQAVLVR